MSKVKSKKGPAKKEKKTMGGPNQVKACAVKMMKK